ncbi:RsmE family RNA methyltransferase [Candidatus Margulisiibacteriota bacterium]
MHRFFVNQDQPATITGSDAHQIKNVLRLKVGDELELLDGTGEVYTAKIATIEKDKVSCEVLEHRAPLDSARGKLNTELRTQVTLAQCLPKARKMDLIIQKCTELGVAKIIPTLSERAIAKGEKLPRWKKLAKEAAEQSGRASIPEISPLTKFKDVLKLKDQYDLALIPWELERETTLKKILTTYLPAGKAGQPNHLLIIIGPEGGFSRPEIELARQAGFQSISLGKTILRTETAGLAIMAMLNYHFNQ